MRGRGALSLTEPIGRLLFSADVAPTEASNQPMRYFDVQPEHQHAEGSRL